jgi:putative SOS response-associated peptidase YedK
MAPVAVALTQAKARFNRAHRAAKTGDALSAAPYDRWRAETLMHIRGQPIERAAIHIGTVDCAMCGRFTQRYTWREIHNLNLTGAARNLQAHYNIAPTDTIEVVRPDASGAAELVSMRWGLIPFWWKKPLKQLPATFNARAESLANKPTFRDAFKRHRGIIPASGYYEWIARPDGKQPYFISAADGGVLNFAGLWDRWKTPETGEPVASCTIIVTDANALTRTIHDRMPVLLDKADFEPWLSGSAGAELLRPAGEDRVRMWPVSRRVNKTGSGDDDPTLIDEVAV